MKKNRKGFTFIEILVAIGILSIISIFALSGFWSNFDRQTLNEELVFFQDTINKLDKEIAKTLTDYEVFINLWEMYYYTLNKNYLQNSQKILSFQWYTGTIQTSTWTDISHIFSNNILVFSHSGSRIYEYDFSKNTNYKIETSNTWKILNSLYIYHYVNIDSRNKIHLIQIENQWNFLTWVILKNNIGQKKQYFTHSWQPILSKINLTFENTKGIITHVTLTP